jgi:Kinesin motor domain
MLQGNFYLENLTEVAVDSVSDAMALYWEAMARKVLAVHDLNDSSSRSHVVLQLSVTSVPIAATDEERSAKLVLVDLAGCERQDQTGIQPTPWTAEDDTLGQQLSMKATQAESIAINKSLMVLRQVLAARSMQDSDKANHDDSKQHRPSALMHIPYRDSKLTSLLKEGLSGSGRMLMIACIAPSQQQVEGTISSLEYACLVCFHAVLMPIDT